MCIFDAYNVFVCCVCAGGRPPAHHGMPPQGPPGHPGYPGHNHPYGMMVPPSSVAQHSPGAAASELRAVLAQPSRLAQQEQILHQRINHPPQQPSPHLPQQQPSPHLSDGHSPGTGQHRLPPVLQEPRTASAPRAEPKMPHNEAREMRDARPEARGTPEVRHPQAPYPDQTHVSHAGASSAFTHPDNPRQQMYTPEMRFPHPMGYPMVQPHMHHYPSAVAVAEFLAKQGHPMLHQGMVPPVLPQHTPPQTEHLPQDGRPASARPPSRHPTPPSAQPSPRAITPHGGVQHPPAQNVPQQGAHPSPQEARGVPQPSLQVPQGVTDSMAILLQVKLQPSLSLKVQEST